MFEYFKLNGSFSQLLSHPSFRFTVRDLETIVNGIFQGLVRPINKLEEGQFIIDFVRLAVFLGMKTSSQGQKDENVIEPFGYNAKIRIMLESFEREYKHP